MSLAIVAAGLMLSQQAPLREITYQDGLFTLKGPEGQSKVSLKPGFEAMNTSTGRLWLPVGGQVLTFDQNGVGFRRNNASTYATYASIATSDKLFSKDQIDQINRDVAANKKSLDVSAVSGWEKIGETVYLILRWDDKQGTPWLEVLMKYEFPKGKPNATFLGRFDSLTNASGRVNDKLMFENGKLSTITHGGETSLLETFDIVSKSFEKAALDARFTDAKLLEGSLFGMGLERTPAKTFLISLIDRETRSSRQVAEVRGSIANLYTPAVLHYKYENRSTLLNLASGAELIIPGDCGIEAVSSGLLLWTPAANPQVAALYSSGSFRTLARWSKK